MKKNKIFSAEDVYAINIHAAYFAEGACEVSKAFSEWRGKNEIGHIEFVSDLAVYATELYAMERAAYAVAGEYPGVIAYEVAEPFGLWFVNKAMELDRMPEKEEVLEYLRREVIDFFARDDGDLRSKLSSSIPLSM